MIPFCGLYQYRTEWRQWCWNEREQNYRVKLLVASHITPWSVSNNSERLSVNNGLLLSATYDRLFDARLITFHGSGKIHLSSSLDPENAARLHLCEGDHDAIMATNKMNQFLEYHADCIFLK